MNNYAYLIKAKVKAVDAKNLFCWFSAKTDARADREILNILEDAGIEVGRAADYQLPIRTDWHITDDLPEEGILDDTWCDRYQLAENTTSWQLIKLVASDEVITSSVEAANSVPTHDETSVRLNEVRNLSNGEIIECEKLPVNLQIAHFWIGGKFTVTPKERAKAVAAEMDMDNGYLQNVILAMNSIAPLKHCHSHVRHGLIEAIKQIWPEDGKKPDLSLIISFSQEWIDALNDTSTEHKKRRADVFDKWLTKYRKERLTSGATAGGMNKTDRNPDLVHTLETLDIEIALALLPFDFDIYDIPKAILRRAKEVIADKESPWKEWSVRLRSCPGILDYSRAAIFAVIRSSAPDIHQFPGSHQNWVTANLTESNHEKPDAHTLELANRSIQVNNAGTTTERPEVTNLGKGIFSIDGLMNNLGIETKEPNKTENTTVGNASNVQMEKVINDEGTVTAEVLSSQEANESTQSGPVSGNETSPLNNEPVHHNDGCDNTKFNHLMIDLETMGTNPDAPIVSIGAVFFEPATGQTGPAFYETISLESSMGYGCIPDASTIEWWLKQSSEARSAILIDTLSLDDALLQFAEFVRDSANPVYTQLWGNGASFDNVLLRRSFERIAIPCELKFFNDRDVRTMVELGKAVGINPRQEIPFDGEQHNALADALHQVKYVSAIWQRLIQN